MSRLVLPLLFIFFLFGCGYGSLPITPYAKENPLFSQFGVGYGGASSFKFHDNVWMDASDLLFGNFDAYQSITDFNQTAFDDLSKQLQKSEYVAFWITKGWQESWFNLTSIQKIIDSGRVPVFIYWYFGDRLDNDYLQSNKDDYLADAQHVATFFGSLSGEKIFIMEPEFNKKEILDAPEVFIQTVSQAIDIVKSQNQNALISLCMMDTGSRTAQSDLGKCGYTTCALGDKTEWSKSLPIFQALESKLDFISFQEMVGQFSRDPGNPGTWNDPNPIAYTDEEIGIDFLGKRVDNFAKFLKDNLHKPVFVPYFTVATATWSDTNADGKIQDNEINATGYEAQAAKAYKDAVTSRSIFGILAMALFDDPTHDEGGYQFFLQNEYHLGIVTAPVQDKQLTGAIRFKNSIVEEFFQ